MSVQAVGERRPGWLTFAAVIMFAVCFTRTISGINYLAGGSQIADLTNTVFGDQLKVWGIWDLCLAALALFAGLSLLVGGGFGRVVGYVWAIWLIVAELPRHSARALVFDRDDGARDPRDVCARCRLRVGRERVMSRKGWIIILVAGGLVLAIVIGLVGNSQSRAETQYCNSLSGLEGAIAEVTSFNPSTGSSGELQADISDVQGAWGDVKSDASQLSDVNQESLDNAWDQFESAVKDLNNGGSTADVQNAAKGLDSAVQSNADTYDCGLASSTTTTSS